MTTEIKGKYVYEVHYPGELEDFPAEFDTEEEAWELVDAMLAQYGDLKYLDGSPKYSIDRWESHTGAHVHKLPDYDKTFTYTVDLHFQEG
jgi:hypothetical protein